MEERSNKGKQGKLSKRTKPGIGKTVNCSEVSVRPHMRNRRKTGKSHKRRGLGSYKRSDGPRPNFHLKKKEYLTKRTKRNAFKYGQ